MSQVLDAFNRWTGRTGGWGDGEVVTEIQHASFI